MNRTFNIAIGTDVVLLDQAGGGASILLIRRRNEPFAGRWALPGGFLEADEDLHEGAARELQEETGVAGVTLHQIGAFGRPDRDPRGRVVSVAFWGHLPDGQAEKVKAADDAAEAQWFAIDALPPLAFDHAEIIAKALPLF